MSFELTEDQELIRKSVAELAGKFDDHYWMDQGPGARIPPGVLRRHRQGRLAGHDDPGGVRRPRPRHHRGHPAPRGGRARAAMNGASAIHLSIFGMQPVVKHGSDELKALPRIVNGDLHVCFGVTEPGAGLDTSRITTFAKREGDTTASTAARSGSPRRSSRRRSCCSPAPRPMTR